MKQKTFIRPQWMQDYAPGYSIFTVSDNSFISDGIIWFQNLDERIEYEEILKIKGFSHVLLVVNEYFGIEAAEKGIQFCNLEEDYFSNPHVHCICREPEFIDEKTFLEAYSYGLKKKGNSYDFSGLAGFAFTILSRASDYLKFLRKLPIPLHIPGTRFCSAFVADCYKHTELYKILPLFREYHVTRIHVHKLWNEFPYKNFRFDKRR